MKKIGIIVGLIVSFSFMTNVTFASILDTNSNLLVHWNFDENQGDISADITDNGYDLTINGANWVEGRNNTSALSFDGVDDVATFSHIDLGSVHTLSLWIKTDGSKDGIVIGKTKQGYLMYFDSANIYYNSGGDVGEGQGSDYVSVPHLGLSESEWTHIVIRRTSDMILMYKNGERLGEGKRLSTENPLTDIETMGAYTENPTGNFHGKFMLEDVRIYSGALDDDEVIELYNETAPPTNTPPYISLNEDTEGNNDITLYVGDTFIDPGVTVGDDEDSVEDLIVSTTTDPIGGVVTNATGTIALIYTVEDTGGLTASTTRWINIIASTTSDIISTTTENTSTSTPTTTLEVTTPEENNDNNEEIESSRNRSGSRARVTTYSGGSVLGAFSYGGGQVLGAFSGPIASNASTSCTAYLDGSLIGVGYENKPAEVEKLKAFLNEYLGSNIDMNGRLDAETVKAVKEFQAKFKSEIITPWFKAGLLKNENPTGFVNKTTIRVINNIVCPQLALPLPALN